MKYGILNSILPFNNKGQRFNLFSVINLSKNIIYTYTWILFIILTFPSKSIGQVFNEIGASAGVTSYQGDLAPNRIGSYKTIQPMVCLWVNKWFTPRTGGQLKLGLGSLKGDDTKYEPEYRKYRAFKFSGQIAELSLAGNYLLFYKKANRRLHPYFLGGVSLILLHIKTDYSGFTPSYFSPGENLPLRLQQDVDIKPARSALMIPVGIGVRYKFSNTICILAEAITHFSQNDYIDGYSLSVNPARNDMYSSFSIGFTYRLSSLAKEIPCPKAY